MKNVNKVDKPLEILTKLKIEKTSSISVIKWNITKYSAAIKKDNKEILQITLYS